MAGIHHAWRESPEAGSGQGKGVLHVLREENVKSQTADSVSARGGF